MNVTFNIFNKFCVEFEESWKVEEDGEAENSSICEVSTRCWNVPCTIKEKSSISTNLQH